MDGLPMTAGVLRELQAAIEPLKGPHPAIPLASIVRYARAGVHEHHHSTLELGDRASTPVVILRSLQRPGEQQLLAKLTRRERQIAALVAQGYRNEQIALHVGISVGTVKDHVHHILGKTGLGSRVDIAARLGHHSTSSW